MNSIAVPRKAKQAIGDIACLMNDNGEERYVLDEVVLTLTLNDLIA